MALSAADLQRRHELEGAPDPFPSLAEPSAPAVKAAKSAEPLDTGSQSAFPSLAPAPASASAGKSAWGAGPRIKPVVKAPLVTDSFTLPAVNVNLSKDEKPVSLGDVLKQVMTKFKVKIDASANQMGRQTTFHMKAESQKELDKAKRHLLTALSPIVTLTLNAPASTIPSIIGSKGATLKQVRDQTNVKVDIPKREDFVTSNGNGAANGDDEEEVTIPITITGAEPMALEAQHLLSQIIASKTSKTTQRVRDIPQHVLPFIVGRRSNYLAIAAEADIKLALNAPEREITISGDREAVVAIAEAIKGDIENYKSSLTSFKISLPKRQHRLLTGKNVDQILANNKCAIIVAKEDDPSDEVVVWGLGADLSSGMSAVIAQANSKYIHEFPLPNPITWARQLLTYIIKTNYSKTLGVSHPGVAVYTPTLAAAAKASIITIDLIGDKSEVDAAVNDVSMLVGKLIGATKDVPVDWLLHRILQAKFGKKIKQFHDTQNVTVYFPAESEETSSILLVYDPFSPNASPSPDDKSKHLDDVTKELLKFAKDVADVKSETIPVEARWHDAVVGTGGTTLNAIIGEDKAISVKVGAEAGQATPDFIVVRGTSSDVDRVVKEILKIVESAKNDEIVNSYSTEFEVERDFVGRIVGSQGAGINRLRDLLGVKVDVFDDGDEKEKESSGSKKKKSTVHQKSKVKITGRQENVEEAKRRILAQTERLADETSEVLKIPNQYHSSLIGTGGKYAIRLEEKYAVKITFPRSNAENGDKTREQLKNDEVLVKGGKKGVAGARAELLDAVEFEKESNNTVKFTVPTRAVARILGRAGASINEIKDATDTQIDVDKTSEDPQTTNITVRGTKKGIAAAKASILDIANQIAEEVNDSLTIEQKFHRALIGSGGQGLKDLATRCGLDMDSKALAALIRFPRQGEPSDEVRLRGEPAVVKKVKAELEKAVTSLRDRVVLGVEVPASQHRALIGRGGQNLNELQTRTGAQVQFPGSRSYNQVGDIENADDLSSVDPANLVKVTGPRAACEKAVEELKKSIKAPAPDAITSTVTVPLKYHHTISQQGNFFRNLRNFGVSVDQSAYPSKPAVPAQPPAGDGSARIDEAEPENGIQWDVVPNYQDAEEGDSTWTIKARDQAGLDRALKQIEEAIKQAERATSVGFLILPDRSMFPRIVGTRGAQVSKMRNETGADITVSRETPTIVITGSEEEITAAKDLIVKMVTEGGRR